MKNITLKNAAVDTLYFVAGSILYGLGLYTFALNAQFAPGGVSGLSLMINHFTGWPIGLISVVINIPLVILSFRVLGKLFMAKSIWAILINTLFLDIVFPRFPTYNGNPLLAALFTGVLIGAGLALIYMRGSSTGGTDFVILAIKKARPHYSIGQITLVIDGAIILLGGLVYKNIDAVLYGILSSFASTLTMDNVLYGAGSGKMAIIVTNLGQTIADAISSEVGRGSTLVHSVGTYTGEKRDMLFCVCAKNEIYRVRTAAHAVDPDALVTITEANEVFGEGFVPPEIKPLPTPPESTPPAPE